MRRGFIILAAMVTYLVTAQLAPGPAKACTVPVFRYALERWPGDRFSAVVFVSGKLSEVEDEVLTAMYRAADAPSGGINMDVEKVDVSGEAGGAGKYRRVWEEQKSAGAKAPWVVIRYPAGAREEKKVMWAGELAAAEMKWMWDSPGRRELGARLLSGDVVFVMVESGSSVRDERAGKIIAEQIPVLEKNVKVSQVALDDPLVQGPVLKSALPVKLKMSMMRISRSDEKEKMLVRMLGRSEEREMSEEMPAVFVVFGRGRVLCGFSGMEIRAENLEDAAKFLAGPCSCQVKELNPGVDLLMGVDWDSVLLGEGREAAAPRVGRVEIPEPKIPQRAPATRGAVSWATTQETGTLSSFGYLMDERTMLKIAIALMAVVMVVTGLMVMRQRRVGR